MRMSYPLYPPSMQAKALRDMQDLGALSVAYTASDGNLLGGPSSALPAKRRANMFGLQMDTDRPNKTREMGVQVCGEGRDEHVWRDMGGI